jgi:hypothetical protein
MVAAVRGRLTDCAPVTLESMCRIFIDIPFLVGQRTSSFHRPHQLL